MDFGLALSPSKRVADAAKPRDRGYNQPPAAQARTPTEIALRLNKLVSLYVLPHYYDFQPNGQILARF